MTNEELVKLIQSGIDQKDNVQLLFEQNIGFIRQVLSKYSYICNWNKYEGYTCKNLSDKDFPHDIIEFQDLMQEAFFGLYKAAMGYDASAGCTFLTYAAYWIKQAVKRYVENSGGVIRVPIHLQEKIYKYNQVTKHYINKFNREPTLQEYADWLYITVKGVIKLQQFMFRKEVISLDTPLTANDDSDLTVADSVADTSVNVEETVIEEAVNEEVSKVWIEVERVLKNPTMRDIILYRFRDDLTLVDTAARLGINRETVRHLESKALRRLRSDSKTRRLFQMIA